MVHLLPSFIAIPIYLFSLVYVIWAVPYGLETKEGWEKRVGYFSARSDKRDYSRDIDGDGVVLLIFLWFGFIWIGLPFEWFIEAHLVVGGLAHVRGNYERRIWDLEDP
jgi:hypothetical protein